MYGHNTINLFFLKMNMCPCIKPFICQAINSTLKIFLSSPVLLFVCRDLGSVQTSAKHMGNKQSWSLTSENQDTCDSKRIVSRCGYPTASLLVHPYTETHAAFVLMDATSCVEHVSRLMDYLLVRAKSFGNPRDLKFVPSKRDCQRNKHF